MKMTYAQFWDWSAKRSLEVKALVQLAMLETLPEGAFQIDDRDVLFGKALLAYKPTEHLPGKKAIVVSHSLNYRLADDQLVIPSVESVSIDGEVFGAKTWETDCEFGVQGRITVEVIGSDLVNAVRELVSQTLTQAMFTDFVWQKNGHDPLKRELFLRGRKVQSVWKSGNRWGTLVGNSHDTLALAMAEAEAAARLVLKSFHDERLAGLDRMAA